jgi:4-amino-4-deoxy-L-arabinose transferase-like glycosyltransferase
LDESKLSTATLKVMGMIFAFTLLVRLIAALPIQQPGYMDAYYYYDGAEALYRGLGFNEEFIWNYLDDPQGIPHPSHLYWPPLSSILAYLAFLVFGPSYRAAQLPFILLSAILPLITYYVSCQASPNRRHAIAAALFTTLSGFYTLYWASPDSFAPFAVTASLSLVAMARGLRGDSPWWFALAGALAALSHLTRADGILLLGVLMTIIFLDTFGLLSSIPHPAPRIKRLLPSLLLALAGYILAISPWFYRNWLAVGTPFPSAGTQTLFLRNYDEIFSYGRELTWQHYLTWGWGAILRSKLRAIGVNLVRLVAENMLIFLAPFILVGLWQLRRRLQYLPFFIYGFVLYLTMTLAFTFPGVRGGLFHSGGALLPFLFAAAMPGLDTVIAWIARRRSHWDVSLAQRMFTIGFVILAFFLSAFIYVRGVFGSQPLRQAQGRLLTPDWNHGDQVYADIAAWLDENAPPEATVMVGNPPGFYYFSHRPGVVVPNEDIDTVLQACDRYGVEFLILDQNRPRPLRELYSGEISHPRLLLRQAFGAAKLFEVVNPHR